jgi:hypothetical protein
MRCDKATCKEEAMSIKKSKIRVVMFSILAFANLACSAVTITQDAESATTKSTSPDNGVSTLTPKQIINARREFKVEVLSFDTSKPYGSKFPYSDYVKLRITNNSGVTLSYITPLTKRYSHGRPIGWSRAPVIAVHDLRPNQSKIIDYYPHGHLSVVTVDKLTVEIEPTIDQEEMRFFKELK